MKRGCVFGVAVTEASGAARLVLFGEGALGNDGWRANNAWTTMVEARPEMPYGAVYNIQCGLALVWCIFCSSRSAAASHTCDMCRRQGTIHGAKSDHHLSALEGHNDPIIMTTCNP